MRVFITGGISGIGKSLGQFFAFEGGKIGVCDIRPANEVGELPDGFSYYQADVTDEEQVKAAITKFAEEQNGLDIVVANAGLNMPKTTIPDTIKGKAVTMVNVLGVTNTFAAALPIFLKQQSGHFVALSSLSGLNGLPGMSYYGASKAFVASFCESLSIDLKEHGIDVTCVTPGFIATPFTQKNTHPMPFLMQAEEAAHRIYQAIKSKKTFVCFPIIPSLFMGLLRRLPRRLYWLIMRKDLLHLRQHD